MPLFSGKCKSKARLDGKTAVITGCNTGIGKETVKDFVKRGCRVIMACRDVSKAEQAAREVSKDTVLISEVRVVRLDLSSFASVRQCAAELLRTEPQINLLINNAGVALCPKALTEDGFETQFATNHLGHFLFTLLLLPRILTSTPARIVNVSSLAHIVGDINFDDINSEKSYSPTSVYAQSKLANILFASELAKRLEGTGVTTYSLHPGVVNTDVVRHWDSAYFSGVQWIFKNVASYAVKTPEQGAQTSIHCAVDEKAGGETGLYYSDCKKTKASSKARDPKLALKLWEESLKMVDLENYDPFTPNPFKEDVTKENLAEEANVTELTKEDHVKEVGKDIVKEETGKEKQVNNDIGNEVLTKKVPVEEDLVKVDTTKEDLLKEDAPKKEDKVKEQVGKEDLVKADISEKKERREESVEEKGVHNESFEDPTIPTTEL